MLPLHWWKEYKNDSKPFIEGVVTLLMTEDQNRLLAKMKKMICAGNKRFAGRKDRHYIQELLDIGITENEAWNEILTLSSKNYYPDSKPFYLKKGDDALIFKKHINGHVAYIKLKIEYHNNSEITVCLSFHIDHK